MRKSFELALLILLLVFSTGLTFGLTYLPCYASLCSEQFFPRETRIHITFYYALLASLGLALCARAIIPSLRCFSEYPLSRKELPLLSKRLSIGGLAATLWILGLTLATTGFWLSEQDFWGDRTDGVGGWDSAKIRLTVTGLIGHHADIPLGLVLIPVSRNSILGRVFSLHTSTLLYAHKLLAYLLFAAAFAHGAAYYSFVGDYAAASPAHKEAFDIDNPTLTQAEADSRSHWYSATLPTGMLGFLAILVMVITALPVLRRRSYNTFYYLHVILSIFVVVLLSIHASTDFYFVLPGLILWLGDWAWRLFRGLGGLRKSVVGKLESAGEGWYRVSLPVSAKLPPQDANDDDVEAVDMEKKMPTHPLQTYFLMFPTVSKLQNHAFTAAKVGNAHVGPVFLFQRSGGKKQKKLEKEWTWKLGALADEEPMRNMDVRVEGPYIPSVPAMFSAKNIICIVGGTGITGAYSIALWWMKYRAQDSGARLTLVWTVRYANTSDIREWRELEDMVRGNSKVSVRVHVSSEMGRLNVAEVLVLQEAEKNGDVVGEDTWVYVSGPEGLLKAGEEACVNMKRERRKNKKSGVGRLDFYAAKWEV